jgi:Dolichyl-phosphate-mannose-protein mannosyltransferase
MSVTAVRAIRVAAVAVGLGVAAGVLYTLSPLTVVFGALLIWAGHWGAQGLSSRERSWFIALLVVAVTIRLLLVAGLFAVSDPARPYTAFFGDEELFLNRSVWIRNLGLGIPISIADLIYVYDEAGQSSYLHLLALLQSLVGNAPYGVHVMNQALYITGVLVLYRFARPSFGGLSAMVGLAVLLFTPSLMIWSVSALKEPVYTLAAVGEIVCAIYVVREHRFWHRGLAVAGVVLGAAILDSLRKGGWPIATVGFGAGLTLAFVAIRPRWLAASLVAAPLLLVGAIALAPVRERAVALGRQAAYYHAGHVLTPGYSYQILDPRYYENRSFILHMPPREVGAFAVRAVVSSVTEPLPWRVESPALRAYWPEQLVWAALLALFPIGLFFGFRRDRVLTAMLSANAFTIMTVVAMTSGNVGTLIRHRGLVLPYTVWLSALGAVQLMHWIVPTRAHPEATG